MTARRVIITQERIVQVDDVNELKCGKWCQFFRALYGVDMCALDENRHQQVLDRNRTEACTGGEVFK